MKQITGQDKEIQVNVEGYRIKTVSEIPFVFHIIFLITLVLAAQTSKPQ